jgi:two-component system C4-dicarboxylate transport response regulator DctD
MRTALFLDEIEDMPLAVQAKLLRALQDRSIERLGSNVAVPVDCRVVAASKEDLRVLSEQKRFRSDLYYRLGVAFIELPPLRERREDIPLLFEHFTLQAATRFERPAPVPGADLQSALMAHPWPGNVRELRNVADRFVLGLMDSDQARLLGQQPGAANLPEQLEQIERVLVSEALRRTQGDVGATAVTLGIAKQTLYDKLKRLRLEPGAYRV